MKEIYIRTGMVKNTGDERFSNTTVNVINNYFSKQILLE